MKRKEAVIRYLALVGRANLCQISAYIVANPTIVSSRLTELKHSGVVHNIKWSDGSKVWVLTPEGYRRHDITSSETKSKKYKQRQKRSNGLIASNYIKANSVNTP